MLRRKTLGGKYNETNNIFWTTMSDLLLGLAIIFMTLFVLVMTGYTQDDVKQAQAKMEVAEKLMNALEEAKIAATVDAVTGDVKISDLELFEVNSYVLSPKGKVFLDKLIPIYIENIFSTPDLENNIANIIVQGHTDSQQYKNLTSENDQFCRNMFLSTQRANAVVEYMFKTNYNKSYDPKLRKIVVVEGKSYSEPVLKSDGTEDFAKSRRVELKLKVKDTGILSALGLKHSSN